MKRLLIIITIILPLVATAAIYKSIDNEGVPSFSDTPSHDSQEINLPPLQHYQTEGPNDREAENSTQEKSKTDYRKYKPANLHDDDVNYRYLRILHPGNEQTFQNIAGMIDVQLEITPAIQHGDKLVLFIDDEPVFTHTQAKALNPRHQMATQRLHATLNSVWRGEHHLQARIFRGSTHLVIESPPVRIYVHQTSKKSASKK